MPLDHYVTLGRSGLRVSPLCLGTMTFGEEWGWGASVEDSVKLLSTYVDRGGNFIDTANIYTKGHSEAIIGDAFAEGGALAGRRDSVVIATKFMGNLHRGDPNGGGAGRKAVIRQCEESLRRLRTDHIDLYWAHFWDQNTPLDELMQTLDDLVRQGKVRYIGFSDHPAWVCVQAQHEALMRTWTPLVALQIEYSLLQRTVEAELMPMARALNLGVTPWSPLRAGILSGKYRRDDRPEVGTTRVAENSKYLNEETYTLIDALVAIAETNGCTPAQAALKWVQDRAGVTSPIIGVRSMAHLEDNLGAVDVVLTAEQTATLDELTTPELPFPGAFIDGVKTAIYHGTTINGETRDAWPLGPTGDDDRW